MSHSTTATSTYVLAKYSKSYPTPAQSTTPEWQHFTNPTMRLVLDMKKGTELESVRLRILWSMDSVTTPDQREVIFASSIWLDLATSLRYASLRKISICCSSLAFHNLEIRDQHKDSHSKQSIVTQSSAFDIYIPQIQLWSQYAFSPFLELDANVLPVKFTQVYRRFQMTFLSCSAVLEFIDAIRNICPCKANPATAAVPKLMNPPSSLPDLRDMHAQNHTGLPAPLTIPIGSSSQGQSESFLLAPPPPSIYTSSPLDLDSSLAPVDSLSLFTLPASGFNIPDIPAKAIGTDKSRSAPRHLETASTIVNCPSRISLPNSSPPTSSANNMKEVDTNNLPMSSCALREGDTVSVILTALRETTMLYDLPRSELEQLVGEVIREEGFTKLLENLNTMWRLKSFVGI